MKQALTKTIIRQTDDKNIRLLTEQVTELSVLQDVQLPDSICVCVSVCGSGRPTMTLYCRAVPECAAAATNLVGWQADGRQPRRFFFGGGFVLQAACKCEPIRIQFNEDGGGRGLLPGTLFAFPDLAAI